jgi:hypothetical protein
MIKANELRIGNWMKRDSQPNGFQIDEDSFFIIKQHPDWYEPIPLTPEILIACGFQKYGDFDNGSVDFYSNGKFKLQVNNIANGNIWLCLWTIPNDSKEQLDVQIKFVHQLQNIFYNLIGKELEIKLPITKKNT